MSDLPGSTGGVNAALDREARRMAQVLDVSVATARRSLENLLSRGLIRLPEPPK